MLAGGFRGAGGPAAGGSVRSRVGGRPGGPVAGGTLRGRIGYGEWSTGAVVQVPGGRWAATAADGTLRGLPAGPSPVHHRQARVGVRQPAGLT
ncbi:hypothetical protein [Micromonospora sp. CA-246542]|uniref:hypothetical protein n=1 Tax=Micromonospora sp. CA-246542 TaxID=3239959 RepID=UPI003D8BF639